MAANIYFVLFLLAFVGSSVAYTVTNGSLVYTPTWIANSYSVSSHVQFNVSGFYVLPDGTVVTSTSWDEGGREVQVYKNGNASLSDSVDMLTHGWDRGGGNAITSDGTYIYFGTTQGDAATNSTQWPVPPTNYTYYYVRRTFINGTNAFYDNNKGSAFIGISTNASLCVTGVAVTTNGSILYVSRSSQIEIYNTSTRTLVGQWLYPNGNAGQIALDASGNLWIAPTGVGSVNLGKQIPISFGRSIAVHRTTQLLLVVDGYYTANNVSVYDVSGTPKFSGYFGTNIHLADTPGLFSDTQPYLVSLVGVGSDAKGNIYVAQCNQGLDIRAFSVSSPTASDGALLWKVQGLEYITVAHYNDKDDMIYGPTKKYKFDFSKSNVGNGTEWSVYSTTIDMETYPWDPRGNATISTGEARVHNFGGNTYLTTIDMYSSALIVYCFDGEIAHPCAFYSKSGNSALNFPNIPTILATQRLIWVDRNGNKYPDASEYTVFVCKNTNAWALTMDSNGTIWTGLRQMGVEAFYYNTISEFGVPLYSNTSVTTWANPSTVTDLQRTFYIPEEDTMVLSGSTKANYYSGSQYWGMAGAGVQVYFNWTTTTNHTPAYEVQLPNATTGGPAMKAIFVYDNILFTVYAVPGTVYVYNLTTGELYGILSPSTYQGWVDTTYGFTVSRSKTTGEWLVLVEEDGHNKNAAYVLPNAAPLPIMITPTPTPSPSPSSTGSPTSSPISSLASSLVVPAFSLLVAATLLFI